MIHLDETHDPKLACAIGAFDTDFPIQNLPFGVFRNAGSSEPFRSGVAIGDQIVDLAKALKQDWFLGSVGDAAESAIGSSLNRFAALGRPAWSALRLALSRNLRDANRLSDVLVPQSEMELGVPMEIGGYTDFYASIEHATNVGRIFRPQQPLLINYTHIPIGYHGRTSSIRPSGTSCIRPSGQWIPPGSSSPVFGPSKQLDYELEIGCYVGPGNELGRPITLETAESHIFGVCLLNDWSARDIQRWEYQPLGPFLGKNFHTSVSPWIVTLDALAPFRTSTRVRDAADARPLPYLSSDGNEKEGSLDIDLAVSLRTKGMIGESSAPHVISRSNAGSLYWTIFQMLAHHTSNGCNMLPGDLIGSGTISTGDPFNSGSLLELTSNGSKPISLPNSETRSFLEDGDEVTLSAYCERKEFRRIGFGTCIGAVHPAYNR